MSEPEKKDPIKNLADGLKGIDLSSTEDKLKDSVRSGAKKGLSFFKKAAAALKGDEAAKEELTNAATGAIINAHDKVERAGSALADIADKVEKKIEQKRGKPPTP